VARLNMSHVHSRINHLRQGGRIIASRPDGADNFGSAHEFAFRSRGRPVRRSRQGCSLSSASKDEAQAENKDWRLK
jgi:hypothetical protein